MKMPDIKVEVSVVDTDFWRDICDLLVSESLMNPAFKENMEQIMSKYGKHFECMED